MVYKKKHSVQKWFPQVVHIVFTLFVLFLATFVPINKQIFINS